MDRDFAALLRVTCDRKLARRTKKQLKKTCRAAHARHKKVEAVIQEQFEDKAKLQRRREKRRRQRERKRMGGGQQQQKRAEREGNDGGGEEDDDANDDEPFEDENYTVKRFEAEAERMRKKRMATELDDDEREIRHLEAKLRKKRRKRGEKRASQDDEDGDDFDLEKAILGEEDGQSD